MNSFQKVVALLNEYWASKGCAILPSSTTEVGAGTLNAHTVLNALGPKEWKIAYMQPSIRPSDGRHGKSPHRLYKHHQYQVIFKPSLPQEDFKDLYIGSLEFIGIKTKQNDIKFWPDEWKNPSIGAYGKGWEVWINGMEVSQITFIEKVCGIKCNIISGEIAYGLERIVMFLQDVDSVYDIEWCEGVSYADIFKQSEHDFSALSIDHYDVGILQRHFADYERIINLSIEKKLPHAAYDHCLKMSHALNLLDARSAIGKDQKAEYLLKIRSLAKKCGEIIVNN